MLSEKLLQASKSELKATNQRIILILSVLLILGLTVLGVIKIDLGFLAHNTSEAPNPSDASSPGLRTQGQANEILESASIKIGTPNSYLDIPPDIDLANVSPVVNQKDPTRQKARSLLAQLQSEVLPAVKNSTFPIWAPKAASEIQTAYLKASSAFAASNFIAAQQFASEALVVGRQKLQDFDQSFLDALQETRSGLAEDNYKVAFRAISAALALKPKQPDAVELKIRVDALPEQLDLIEKASIARNENNLPNERDALSKLIALAPSRTLLAARLVTVEKELKEAEFAVLIDQSDAALSDKDIKRAEERLKKAEKIFKGRRVTANLQDRITNLENELTGLSFLRKAKSAEKADDWQAAQIFYSNAEKHIGTTEESALGQYLAAQILSIEKQFDQHLGATHRLSSPNVERIVEQLLQDAVAVINRSPRLKLKFTLLTKKLRAYTTEVPVRVKSDKKTFIRVEGLGIVGKTDNRIIQLRPGRYIFQGECAGYKSVSIEVDIPPNFTSTVVEVRCREKV